MVKTVETILITGAAGFIGSHLAETLINHYKIIAIDDFNDFYSPYLKMDNLKNLMKNPNFNLYRANISDYFSLEKIFDENKISKIIHLAARAGVRPSLTETPLYTQTNINGTVNLLELAKKHNIKKFVFASSSSVYGSQKTGPFHEEMQINKPISPYAATKAAGEQLCHSYSHLYDMQINCLRFFTVYGARQRPDLAISKFARLMLENKPIPVFGDLDSKRDYTYIDDIISGILGAINYNTTPFEIFNLGESQTVELYRMIELLEKNLNKRAIIDKRPSQPGDVPLTFADISKSKALLNYNPTTKIEQGLEKFTAYFTQNQALKNC